jgi:RimJ/RimL family protein N-acetyltransferase
MCGVKMKLDYADVFYPKKPNTLNEKIKYILEKLTEQDRKFMDDSVVFKSPVFQCIEEVNRQPIGFIEASPTGNDVYINIAVIPSARRTGVARKLFHMMLPWFNASDYDSLRWNTEANNHPSANLAISLGFTEFHSPMQDENMRYFALGK